MAQDRAEQLSGRLVASVGLGSDHFEGSDVLIGLAGGADYQFDKDLFGGVEVSLTHAFNTGHHHWLYDEEGRSGGAIVARGGAIVAPRTKAYGLIGIAFANEEHSSVYGAGIEREYGRLLASLEYRHADNNRSDQVRVGLGVKF